MVELIKGDVRCELTWRLDITTEERTRIIFAHIQRRFHSRVKTTVNKRRPMAVLFQIFDMGFAERLRLTLNTELKARYHLHPSAWSQTCGIWSVVQRVLQVVLLESERRRKRQAPKSMLSCLRDRLCGLVKPVIVIRSVFNDSLENPLEKPPANNLD